MKRIIFATWVILLSVPTAFADFRVSTISNTPDITQNGLELIADPKFTAGFSAIPACNRPDSDAACATGSRYNLRSPAYPQNSSVQPAWDLAQWGSRTNFQETPTPYGVAFAWSTDTKRLAIYPDGTIEMAVDGVRELNGKYLSDRTSWPSLIASETIAAPGAYGRDVGNLTKMTKLLFNLDFRLLNDNVMKRQGYDQSRDALIFPINLTVQNLNRASAGYGEYVWLQVVAYDDRYITPNQVADKNMIDLGTKKLIYFVPSDAVTRDNVHRNQWAKFNGDVLPFAKRSVQFAFEKGLLKSQDLTDYSIGGINIGYELTGLNIATFQFRNLSLKAFY
ncbi:hypothetical protein [Rhizobium miluonense]|uniref:Uncharacterized protein n=1 Tax=Rhizobium miluonense TaxID=411945 RepID=A0ABU1SM13_9HYPH|nr:hypothetical protein [Rhizobium miluonense]MDR6899999.1 hypothetical protein [Rhizobium miluonense]